jgi:phosphatidate cytidylyltransferase
MLFGKSNKGIVAASPNKSIVGFVAGIASSVALGVAAAVYFPDAFRANPEIEGILKAKFSPISSGIILGLTTGIASTLGDLAESALKRSAGVKDSGNLMLGRGGVLDCIDSLSIAAPVFFIVYNVLFEIK